MPPRHAYWTIIVEDQPTSFRAHDLEELLPTFNRLREKHPSAVMKWFERGQLWESRDAARAAGGGEGERRQKTWRPGGEHRDPRQKFKDAKKAKWDRFKKRVRGRWDEKHIASPPHGDPLRDRIPPRGGDVDRGDRRPESRREDDRGSFKRDDRRPPVRRDDWRARDDRPGGEDRRDRPRPDYRDRDRPSPGRDRGGKPSWPKGGRPEWRGKPPGRQDSDRRDRQLRDDRRDARPRDDRRDARPRDDRRDARPRDDRRDARPRDDRRDARPRDDRRDAGPRGQPNSRPPWKKTAARPRKPWNARPDDRRRKRDEEE